MRLDKYIASVTDLSRKQARQAIRDQEVTVDGEVLNDPGCHIEPQSEVGLAGVVLRPPGFRYLMLYKPEGVVCATKDAHQMTVIDLLTVDQQQALQIAGRLDIDTTGLVLLTDDGQWNHRLTSPRTACNKVYELSCEFPIANDTARKFERGVMLLPENRRTRPARLMLHSDPHRARLILTEGRYHQVKRMFAAIGNHVVTLHRSAIGDIQLDPALEPGQYRPLTPVEVASV